MISRLVGWHYLSDSLIREGAHQSNHERAFFCPRAIGSSCS